MEFEDKWIKAWEYQALKKWCYPIVSTVDSGSELEVDKALNLAVFTS